MGVVPDVTDPTQSRPGFRLGAHGTGELVYTGPIDALIDNDCCLNDGGDVAFTLSTSGTGNNRYLYAAAAGSAGATSTLPVIPNSYANPCVDTMGDIGFGASFPSGDVYAAQIGGIASIYVGDAATVPGSPDTYLYTPSFNAAAAIAAKVANSDDQFTKVEIHRFASDGSSVLVLANQATDPQLP